MASGQGTSVAVGVGRLSGKAAFFGKVGDDEFGHMLLAVLRPKNVDVSGVKHDPHARTALAFVTLRESDGEREFMFYRNPMMLTKPEELDEDLIRGSGRLLSYDPNLRLPLWPSLASEAARDGILSILTLADIIKVSDEEVKFLTNGQDETPDDVVLTLWHPNLGLLVTDGPDGCRYYTSAFKGRVDSFPVAIVDTTGAGDAFVAGLLNELVQNKGLLEDETALRSALQFANACDVITTTRLLSVTNGAETCDVERGMLAGPVARENLATIAAIATVIGTVVAVVVAVSQWVGK